MQKETEHFNDRVPQDLRDKLQQLAQAAKDDFISDCGVGESYGCADTNAIYGYHISGFIPSQLGGYEVTELYRSDNDSSYHFTSAQTEAQNKYDKDCFESFCRDNDLPESATYEDVEKAGLDNELSEYESEWFTPALLRLEMWVDDVEHKQRLGLSDDATPQQVFLRLSLNWSDAPYYRASGDDETFYEAQHTVADFMAQPVEHWLTILRGAIAGSN